LARLPSQSTNPAAHVEYVQPPPHVKEMPTAPTSPAHWVDWDTSQPFARLPSQSKCPAMQAP
jgi:hypothetical protein